MDINEIVRQAVEEVLSQLGGGAAIGGAATGELSKAQVAGYIDHTLLKPEASQEQVRKICDEAKANHFASVCVNTTNCAFVANELRGSGVKTCVVIGFPLGACTTETKVFEAQDAIMKGAQEVDMVVNVGAIKSGNWDLVFDDIKAVANACKGKALLKVIIETCLLTDDEKVKACQASKHAGADFVKTSTGFSTGGATVEDVRLMRQTVGPTMGVKASGGVRTYDDAIAMIKAGATRLGTSNGVQIVTGAAGEGGHTCINCGRCKSTCPTGATKIINNNY